MHQTGTAAKHSHQIPSLFDDGILTSDQSNRRKPRIPTAPSLHIRGAAAPAFPCPPLLNDRLFTMSFLARLFRPWRTEADPVPVLSESGEPTTVRAASRADTLRIDFLRPRRRDIYTQTENTIANLTSTESETVIRVPITFRPSADERYVSARRALPARAAVAQHKEEPKSLPPEVETESPPAEKKKADEFLLCALSKQAKPVRAQAPAAPRVEVKRDTAASGGEPEKVRVKKAPKKEETRAAKEEPRSSEKKERQAPVKSPTKSQEDTFAFTNFTKKEEEKKQEDAFVAKKEEPRPSEKKERQAAAKASAKSQEDTFSFTNFAKKEEEKKDEDTFSFTNFAKKEEETKDEDTFTFTNFAKKDESSEKPATKTQSDTFSVANFQKKEDTQAEQDKPPAAASTGDIRAKLAAIMAKTSSEAVTATDDIATPKFASTLETDFSRFSSIVNESGGFSYEPASTPDRPKYSQRPQKKRRPS